MGARPIYDQAECLHCPVPLTKSFGRWVHPWLYQGACNTPEADPETIRLDVGK